MELLQGIYNLPRVSREMATAVLLGMIYGLLLDLFLRSLPNRLGFEFTGAI